MAPDVEYSHYMDLDCHGQSMLHCGLASPRALRNTTEYRFKS